MNIKYKATAFFEDLGIDQDQKAEIAYTVERDESITLEVYVTIPLFCTVANCANILDEIQRDVAERHREHASEVYVNIWNERSLWVEIEHDGCDVCVAIESIIGDSRRELYEEKATEAIKSFWRGKIAPLTRRRHKATFLFDENGVKILWHTKSQAQLLDGGERLLELIRE